MTIGSGELAVISIITWVVFVIVITYRDKIDELKGKMK